MIHVADENCLSWTNNDTCRFELHVDAMRAEVTLLRRVIVGVDEDCVVRACGHARLAADADRFIKIDNPISAFEHRGRRAGGNTRSMSALIATRHLVSAARLWKHADINMFDVSARDGKRNEVFRLARRSAGMTSDAACVVNYLSPLNRGRRFHHKQAPGLGSETITFPSLGPQAARLRVRIACEGQI